MGGTPEHQLTQRPEPRPSGRRGGPALHLTLNLARIVPRQEAVDSSNNLYRPTNLMAPCAPVPDAQIGQAARATRSWLEAELLDIPVLNRHPWILRLKFAFFRTS